MTTGVEMKSRGTLTPAQHEIVETIWNSGRPLTSAEVWAALNEKRSVARTTVQTLLDRLVKRGWLVRDDRGASLTFEAVCSPGVAEAKSATQFLKDYFEGSPSRMVMSLLGNGEITADEVQRLKAIFDEHAAKEENGA